MQEQIMDLVLKQEEVGWKDILYDLIKSEQMDPWHIDVTLLTQKYIATIKEMQEHNLRVSGKILLAAAYLLKMKSAHLLDNDISKFDLLLNPEEEFEEEFFEENGRVRRDKETFPLIPKNPQPRNRKVSIHDLVNALQRAMATKKRVLQKMRPVKFTMPSRKIDIMEVIKDVYHKVQYYSKKDKAEEIAFSRLLPAKAGREDKVFTFLPLLHLENERKIAMVQENAFDEIMVSLKGKTRKAK